MPPTAAAYTSFNYTSPNTGVTFVFNNTPVSSTAAQQQCQIYGGNLATFMSLEEQQEIEAAFVARGDLVPEFHQSYWLGLYTAELKPPQFMWNDQLSGKLNWTHWGMYRTPDGNISEPNNMFGQENCGAANASQTYSDAWGWMDINCNIRMPFMCRLNSGRSSCSPSILRPPSSCLCRLSHAAWLTAQHGPRPPGRARCGH
jgi:hypothetical protein